MKYGVAVIKNVKHHSVDKKGKDSYKFTGAGASYSVIQNVNDEFAIFLKIRENKLDEIISWLEKGPYKIDLLITEGFRNLNNPTILCVKDVEDVIPQLTENVKMISGIICSTNLNENHVSNLPLLDIEKDFQRFLEIFRIK